MLSRPIPGVLLLQHHIKISHYPGEGFRGREDGRGQKMPKLRLGDVVLLRVGSINAYN